MTKSPKIPRAFINQAFPCCVWEAGSQGEARRLSVPVVNNCLKGSRAKVPRAWHHMTWQTFLVTERELGPSLRRAGCDATCLGGLQHPNRNGWGGKDDAKALTRPLMSSAHAGRSTDTRRRLPGCLARAGSEKKRVVTGAQGPSFQACSSWGPIRQSEASVALHYCSCRQSSAAATHDRMQ